MYGAEGNVGSRVPRLLSAFKPYLSETFRSSFYRMRRSARRVWREGPGEGGRAVTPGSESLSAAGSLSPRFCCSCVAEVAGSERTDSGPIGLSGQLWHAGSIAVWVLSSTVLWYHYAGTQPKIPHTETGNICELNTHGSLAYLTYGDCLRRYGTLGLGFGGNLTLYIVYLRRRGWITT